MNKWQDFKSSEEFKARINELLSDKSGVTKKDIALEMGVDFRSLSNAYNYGIIPRPMTLAKIADYFNVPIDYLLGRSENDYFVKGKANDSFYDRYTALRDELKVTDYQIAASLLHENPDAEFTVSGSALNVNEITREWSDEAIKSYILWSLGILYSLLLLLYIYNHWKRKHM